MAKRRKPVTDVQMPESDVRTPESKDQTPENYVDNKAIPQILDNLSMNKDSGAYKCPYCKSKFSQKHNLKRHIKQKHEKNIKTNKEKIGDENSDDKDEKPNNENQTLANDLKNSNNTSDGQKLEKIHEKTNDKNLKVTTHEIAMPYNCGNCNLTFFRKQELLAHVSSFHEAKEAEVYQTSETMDSEKNHEYKPKNATYTLEDVDSIVCSKNKDVLFSNPQDIGKIEETSDNLKDSDDSKDQTNEAKTPEADENETPNTGMI